MDRTLLPRYKTRVEAILQKTYDQHGLKGRPWGINHRGTCSYERGCAIGVSMRPEVAARADNNGYGAIRELLRKGDAAGMIAGELFGTRDLPPENVAQVLAELQNIHDNFASDDSDRGVEEPVYRAMYRLELEKLAGTWNLNLDRHDQEES